MEDKNVEYDDMPMTLNNNVTKNMVALSKIWWHYQRTTEKEE